MVKFKLRKLKEFEFPRRTRKIQKYIPIHNEYMGMYWFIETKGLREEFENFYDNFSVGDTYKYKKRKKKE